MEELLGKEVKVIGAYDKSTKMYYVAQIDKDKGITLKTITEIEPGSGWSEEVCLNIKEHPTCMYNGTYEEHWEWWIKGIKAGVVDWSKKKFDFGLKNPSTDCAGGSSASCAF